MPCHRQGSDSPLAIAPPFRTLHLTYHLICPSFGSPLSGQCPERRGVGAVFLPSRIGRILCELVRTPPFASTNRAYPLKISHDLRVSLRDSLPVELDLVHPPIQLISGVGPFAGENGEIGSANADVAGDAFHFGRTASIKFRHRPPSAVPVSPPMRKPTNKTGPFTCLSQARHGTLRDELLSYALSRRSAERLRSRIRRRFGTSIAAASSKCLSVRETVSMVRPR